MRILAVDYGDRRTGLAFSDERALICGDAFTISERNMDAAAQRVAAEAAQRGAGLIVLGLPKNMDGSEGPRAQISREFAGKLREETGLEVVFWDERRSTVEAHAILHAVGKKEKKHKATIDAVAASLILEGYLGTLR